jgi:hypothetical protein
MLEINNATCSADGRTTPTTNLEEHIYHGRHVDPLDSPRGNATRRLQLRQEIFSTAYTSR